MMLLKELAMKGKLVVVNIHQPSSDLFKLFDQLVVLDKGGYPVYSGNPVEGIMYFKQLADRVDASESECASCGNTDPDEILQIIEERDINEFGEFSNTRKTSPREWYQKYIENIQSRREFVFEKKSHSSQPVQDPGPVQTIPDLFQTEFPLKTGGPAIPFHLPAGSAAAGSDPGVFYKVYQRDRNGAPCLSFQPE